MLYLMLERAEIFIESSLNKIVRKYLKQIFSNSYLFRPYELEDCSWVSSGREESRYKSSEGSAQLNPIDKIILEEALQYTSTLSEVELLGITVKNYISIIT